MALRNTGLLGAVLLTMSGSSNAASPQIAEAKGGNVNISAPEGQIPEDPRIGQAAELIASHKPAEAIVILDAIIAEEDRGHARESRPMFSARSTEETLMYALDASTSGKEAVVFGPTWATAIFLKGFALIDLGTPEAAGPLLTRAVELAPMNAQFLSELGEWHKVRREWTEAFALFKRAEEAADISPENLSRSEKGRALRGMGYVLLEQDQLDEAEKLYRKSLKLNPNDQTAKDQLLHIQQRRSRNRQPNG